MKKRLADGLKTWLGTKSNEFARTMLTGLSVCCPLGEVSLQCPLKDVRALPHREKVNWLNAKNDAEIEEIYSHHYACLKERE